MTNIEPGRTSRNEQGIALVLSLFLMMAMSVVGASLMFLSQTETYSSMNYRLMSQARYGAESGIQKTVNFLANSSSYTPPSTTGADLLSNYDTTKSPVLCTGGACTTPGPVVLSAGGTLASNYPVLAVQTAFANTVGNPGSLPSGSTTVSYAPYATLLSMQQIKVYGGGYQTIQTWQITSAGTINAGKTATVEVTATLESEKIPATMYAAFGTNGGCGALDFQGNNTVTNSYDSTNLALGISSSGGNVGTNGNLTQAGGATINGSLSTPRVGVGSCSSGNVSALTSSGGATVTSGVVQLPQQVTLPTPALPSPLPPTTSYQRKRPGPAQRCVGRQRFRQCKLHPHALRGQSDLYDQHQQHHAERQFLPGDRPRRVRHPERGRARPDDADRFHRRLDYQRVDGSLALPSPVRRYRNGQTEWRQSDG